MGFLFSWRNLILFIFSFTANNIFAQLVKFPTKNARWCYNQYADDGSNLGNFCIGFEESDTLINDKIYSPLLSKLWTNSNDTLGFFREESNRVYILPTDTSKHEILLYDFNLGVGDTFRTMWSDRSDMNQEITLKLSHVNLLEMEDGIVRKEYYLRNDITYDQIIWVEGVGDAEWLFYKPLYSGSLSGGFSLLCQIVEGQIEFESYSNAFCNIVNNETIISNHEIQISPNPFRDDFKLDFNKGEIYSFFIYDNLGRMMDFVDKRDITSLLNYSNLKLTNGTYYIVFIDSKNDIVSKSVIVKEN